MLPIHFTNDRYWNIALLQRMKEETESCNANFGNHDALVRFNRICLSISDASKVNPNLVAIGCLFATAAASRGQVEVLCEDGRITPLSMIGFVGCDPASGKSTALAPFISVFKKYMEAEVKALEEQENAIAVKNAILKKTVNRAIKNASKNLTLDNLIAFADIGFTEGNDYLRVMGETLRKKQDKILPPILLVNDLSSAALSVLMDQQGYVIQLEPDGGRFDFKVLRQVTKYWSDEGHSQVRVSRKSSIVLDPFVTSLTFTQRRYFGEFIANNDVQSMGLFGRVLMFIPAPYHAWGTPSPVPADIEDDLKTLLFGLLDASRDKQSPKTQLTFTAEAWRLLDDYRSRPKFSMTSSPAISSWNKRATEHAIRIAAILHLIEREADETTISVDVTQAAIDFAEVFRTHAEKALFSIYDNRMMEACRYLAELILKRDQPQYFLKDLKYAAHNTFTAVEVELAIFYLEQFGLISEDKANKSSLGACFRNNAFKPSVGFYG